MNPERWQKIQDLFDEALLLAEDERGAFLHGVTAGDDDLLREVVTLLAADAQNQSFIDEALCEGLELFFEDEAAEPSTLGKYALLEKIGEGGFGKVYRGRDPQLRRVVAVKTCSARDPTVRQRFFREARIAAGLQHPRIVTIHDFGEEGGVPYLVQEMLDGEDLDRIIERRDEMALAVKQNFLWQIAEGLSYAHDENVLHRDIKPENVRVMPEGEIKILDFGIARLLNEQKRLTRENMTVGTVGYMAPEQLRGLDVDERSDVFSFGVLAYELLALERPFLGRTFSEISHQILHREPRRLQESHPEIPERLAELVHRCLEKNPDDRFPDFRPVVERLAEVAEPSSPEPGVARFRVSLASAAALVGVAMVTLASVFVLRPGEGEPPRPEGPLGSVAEVAEPTPEGVVLADERLFRGGVSASDVDLPASGLEQATEDDVPPAAPASAVHDSDAHGPSTEVAPLPPSIPAAEGPSKVHRTAVLVAQASAEEPAGLDGELKPAEQHAESVAVVSALTLEPSVGQPPSELREPAIESAGELGSGEVAAEVEEDLVQPVLVRRADPRYPVLAQRRKREAQVTVAVFVDRQGLVQRTLVTYCSNPGFGFEEAARAAALETSFRPAEQKGAAVQAWTELAFDFRLR